MLRNDLDRAFRPSLEREDMDTFQINDIPFLPHYWKPCVYVAPGGSEYTLAQLQGLGAKKIRRGLWKRDYQ